MSTHEPHPPIHRGEIQGFARNIVEKFACSAAYYEELAWTHQVRRVEIDLLSLDIRPEVFHSERNIILVQQCRKVLELLMIRLLAPAAIHAATIIAEYEGFLPGRDLHIGVVQQCTYTVVLTDELGKPYASEMVTHGVKIRSNNQHLPPHTFF